MAYTTINKSTLHFDTNLYTANGSGKTISGMGFSPSMIWTKNRVDANYIHAIVDQVRGGTKKFFPNGTADISTDTNAVTSFTSDGYVFGSSGSFNYSTNNYVNWCWKGAGSGSANTDGDINSTVSVNTTGGFSVVKYQGSGSAQTVGHGLGTTPEFIIVKRLSGTGYEPVVYHVNKTTGLYLNSTANANDGSSNNIWFNGAAPTSSLFTTGTDGRIGSSGVDYIAYCFAPKVGYCKIGKYVGNGNADGAFIYTGMAPTLLVYKNTSQSDEWFVHDSKRPGYNPTDLMFWSADNAEVTNLDRIELMSNGFKTTTTDKGANASGDTYIYIAFGQSIVGSNNIPTTSR
tara:strand:+ start:22 stop:1056 length:1035 start_codon:yes stop_codon:yes gene_type:complete